MNILLYTASFICGVIVGNIQGNPKYRKQEIKMKCNDCEENAVKEMDGINFCEDCAEDYEDEE